MNREASMTSYLKVLPILGGLLTACASQSPVDEIVASVSSAVEYFRTLSKTSSARCRVKFIGSLIHFIIFSFVHFFLIQ